MRERGGAGGEVYEGERRGRREVMREGGGAGERL